MSDIIEIFGAVGGASGIGSMGLVAMLFKRTKDLETANEECTRNSIRQAIEIGRLTGKVEILSTSATALTQATRAVERIADSIAPPPVDPTELDRRVAELTARHRKSSDEHIPIAVAVPPPPPFPKGLTRK